MRIALLVILLLVVFQVASAQRGDSLAAVKSNRLLRAVIVPSVLIAGGFAARPYDVQISKHFARPEEEEARPKTSMRVADFTQYAPIAFAYGLSALSVKGEHKVLKSTALLVQSELLMIAIVRPMKHLTQETRPDGSTLSFPSGHTAQAFVAATFLHKEFGHKSRWYSIAGYTMASTVGICRMISNRHWMSDVLVGAGIGVLSTNLVYLGHKHRSRNKVHFTVLPTYNRGPGMYMAMRL